MNCIEIAKKALKETEAASQYVNGEVRKLLAFGKVAIIIRDMDSSVCDGMKVYRLEEALLEIERELKDGSND